MTTTATLAPATSTAPAASDHEISVATAASELGVQPATVRRYLRSGRLARLARLGRGVSADSVAAYAAQRANNTTRTRFKPADTYTPADLIQAACAQYSAAADLARQADRGKRAARKTLDVVGDGQYGPWAVERADSGRQVADLAEITRIFLAHGLGEVPMKDVAPSLKVTRLAA
jgi:predicted transcriptional regulator